MDKRNDKSGMKFPITWHEKCLGNSRLHLERDRRYVEGLAHRLQLLEAQIAFYAEQISEARQRGMDGFDSERFLVKRKPRKP